MWRVEFGCSSLVHDCSADLIKPFGSFVKCEKLKKLSLNYGGGITKQREIMYANKCVVHQTFLWARKAHKGLNLSGNLKLNWIPLKAAFCLLLTQILMTADCNGPDRSETSGLTACGVSCNKGLLVWDKPLTDSITQSRSRTGPLFVMHRCFWWICIGR